MIKLPLTKEYLEDKYVTQGMSSTKIAEELGCNYMTVLNKLKAYSIPTRKDGILHPILTKEFLEEEYHSKGKGLQAIAKEVECSPASLRRRMKKYGLLARPKDTLIERSGETYGQWTVLKKIEGERVWRCLCICGKEFDVGTSNLLNGVSTCCRYCSRSKCQGDKHKGWKGHEGISGTMWCCVKQSAKKRAVEFDITIEYIWNLFLRQKGKCALSGLDIVIAETASKHSTGQTTASLDRIDSHRGYLEGNVQWLHKDVNRAKTNFDQSRFVEMCLAVAKHQSLHMAEVESHSIS